MDARIPEILSEHRKKDTAAANHLVEEAIACSGKDNTTAVIVTVEDR
jgi:serine/threonine protein phosphatase PrpC